ncbi:MAG: hypothetical protein Kow00108_15500 [Calditrichia bacterium]
MLGFEYGYAYGRPESLTIWEAQFGDFTNGAQIIVDEFITSAESKWNKLNGLVLYLPHGYEGQGADHSSARIERFMDGCANNNMQVVYPSTPTSLFHLLRAHMKMSFRLPLIIFTPKSLLRHPECVSTLDELSAAKFTPVIDDPDSDPQQVQTVVFCSGKIYYELAERKRNEKRTDLAIIRLEQLYPYPAIEIQEITEKYPNATTRVWIQEEPENMGYMPFLKRKGFLQDAVYIARPENSAPATGFYVQHNMEQKKLIDSLFQLNPAKKKEKLTVK